MIRLFNGSIFRASLLLALGGAGLLALASITVILSTAVPFDFPVATLDVARALRGEALAKQSAPLRIGTVDEAPFDVVRDDPVARVIAASIARQGDFAVERLRVSFGDFPDSAFQRRMDVARRAYEVQLMEAARVYGGDPRFSPLLFGRFRVALQLPDGRWRIVERTPSEPPWQYSMAKGIGTALLLITPLAWWGSRRLSRPIMALGDAARRIGAGSGEEVAVEGPVEVRQVAQAMNHMQARLRADLQDREQMLAAIAHDLRTPLARLAFLLAAEPIAQRERVDAEIAEMNGMIGTAMDFVRSASTPARRDRVDLVSLLQSVCDDWADRGHRAEFSSPGDGIAMIVDGDATLLKRVFDNLVGNAATHGRAAKVSARIDGATVVVDVRDEGPGMTEVDLARAFEPFFRAERSRNRDTGGVGLGLAIAKRGVESHGGHITLRNASEGGLIARVTLPA
ncbi:MAG: ATP-binding protein [Silanimonas sp.]